MANVLANNSFIVFLPVIIMVTLTIKSKKILEPIIFSTALCYAIKYGLNFVRPFVYGIISVIRSESFSFIIVMLLCFGATIAVIEKSGGIQCLIRVVQRKVKSKTGSLIITWLLGLSLFMDDYLNSLIVGTTMKNVTDGHKIPREMIATTAISTGVPICLLAPISSWAVFLFSVISANGIDVSQGLINMHLKILPFVVYAFTCILGSLLLILGIIPKVGDLKRAYKRAEEKGQLIPIENKLKTPEVEDHPNTSILNFIVPMATLIGVSIITKDVAIGGVCSIVAGIIVCVPRKVMTLGELVEVCVTGMSEMVGALIFMVFAFLFGKILTEMGFATTVIKLIKPFMIGEIIPFVVFWLVAMIVFGGVDVWAVMPLAVPIIVPLSQTFDINIFLSLGAMLSGISFGTQICFISESHILISETLDLKPIQQVMAHMPYALSYAVVTSIVYLLLGFTF